MLGLAELAVLGFASYRATQLVVWDSIGDPLRLKLELWHAARNTSRVRTFLRRLLGCIYCVGWWLSLAAVATYLTAVDGWGEAPLLVHAVEFWAVAGIQALLNRIDDALPGHVAPQPTGGE